MAANNLYPIPYTLDLQTLERAREKDRERERER
jgi:hypothetical protein